MASTNTMIGLRPRKRYRVRAVHAKNATIIDRTIERCMGQNTGGRGHDLIARLYGGDNHPVDREEPYDAEQQGEDSGAGAARDLAGVGSAAGRCRLRCAMRYGPWILNTFHKDDPLFQGFANISVPVAISGVGYGSATPSPPSTSTTDSLHASSPSICWGAGIDESPISSDRRTCRRRRRRQRARS